MLEDDKQKIANIHKLVAFEKINEIKNVFAEGDLVKILNDTDEDFTGIVTQVSRYKQKNDEGTFSYYDVYFVTIPKDEENSRWYFRNELIETK